MHVNICHRACISHDCKLSYPEGTSGHPADKWVELKLVNIDDWKNPSSVVKLFGGQGTINVNSWSPDSRYFAYVAYPTGRATDCCFFPIAKIRR